MKPRTQLTESQVAQIKRRLEDGVMAKQIAQDFKVSDACISYIKTGKRWWSVKPAKEVGQ